MVILMHSFSIDPVQNADILIILHFLYYLLHFVVAVRLVKLVSGEVGGGDYQGILFLL